MSKLVILFLILIFTASVSFAKNELVAKAVLKTETHNVNAELYYDKVTNHPDVWIDFDQQPTAGAKRIQFKATSIASRQNEAEIRLVLTPITRLDGQTIVIYDAFEIKSGNYTGDYGFALLFHYPLASLSKETIALLVKNFPNSIVKDAPGKPGYVKAVLASMISYEVLPIAAFDVDLSSELAARP